MSHTDKFDCNNNVSWLQVIHFSYLGMHGKNVEFGHLIPGIFSFRGKVLQFWGKFITVFWLIISRSSHVVCGAYLLTGTQHTLRAGIVRDDRELFHRISLDILVFLVQKCLTICHTIFDQGNFAFFPALFWVYFTGIEVWSIRQESRFSSNFYPWFDINFRF